MLGIGHDISGRALRVGSGCGTVNTEALGDAHLGNRFHFCVWIGDWQLPERLHHKDSGGSVDRRAGFALPAL